MSIYLDGHASTPVAPEAIRAMAEAWMQQVNVSSPHHAGNTASASVEMARALVAGLIGADASEIIFTSGATEANNLALLGAVRASAGRSSRRKIIVSAIEHKSVSEPARHLEKEGFEIVVCPVFETGVINLRKLEELATPDTLLVSVMIANNEIGVLQPIEDVVRIARQAGALVHADAAQASGRVRIDVMSLDVDYMSISAHKMYGPQGVGALYISSAAYPPKPLVLGGGHEGGIRSGTLPHALIVGFGAAAKVASQSIDHDRVHSNQLAEVFLTELASLQVRHVHVGERYKRLPGSLALRLSGIDADLLVQALGDQVSLTTGSACNSGEIEPSHVLRAIGLTSVEASEFIRVCFTRYGTAAEAVEAARHIAAACRKVRLATGEVRQ